ncbi:alpha-D-ribose 1-methylphosphonate 5-triphosphate diphosphatase [Clostridium acidisoli DSM 12555]|uniref:Alpha-D-ribose 1-methylphosphonate 5-triphosphate diphosphatase n=1 Tax=Clostridium acidisoli DSM 12555 TaxID=1121291 RepID=A0A1W1XT26_9CLOT|nr:phosphonate metabolism protein PhnM [Clostridium acidisoli]SMC27037.1 alpha-D-ribose 1-methylphosphonate 5-triphosphate diphosphatase [Clostridium acidisoli DSM 12555]
MYIIKNGKIVTENEILEGYDLIIENDLIKEIRESVQNENNDPEKVIDARGGYVAPGFIDIHSDYIENMAAPRPSSIMDFSISLREEEKILVNQGITTMFHSITMDRNELKNVPIRNPKNVKEMINAISNISNDKHLIKHHFHARIEIDNINEIDNIKKYIEEDKVQLISFMDHTPGQGQYRNLEVYRKTLKDYRDISEDEIEEIIHASGRKEKITDESIKEIAALALGKSISIASHDDDSVEKLKIVQGYGARISEFPITLDVAKSAKSMGMYTIAGAPNVLLGGSHSGNLCAAEAIKNDCIDILCSDYYPAAMLHAVFLLNERHGMDLGEMFNLVTINPAKAVNMDNSIGSIKKGKKADIIIIEKLNEQFPVITSVFVDGKLKTRTNY